MYHDVSIGSSSVQVNFDILPSKLADMKETQKPGPPQELYRVLSEFLVTLRKTCDVATSPTSIPSPTSSSGTSRHKTRQGLRCQPVSPRWKLSK